MALAAKDKDMMKKIAISAAALTASIIADFIPYVSNVKAAYEAAYGIDPFTREKLDTVDQSLAAASIAFGPFGKVPKRGKQALEGLDEAIDAAEEIASAVEKSKVTPPKKDKTPGKYDKSGDYTGGRSKEELDKLADDPAHAGSKRPDDINQGLLEQRIGLGLEEKGKLKGPITRDPSGKSELFDADGQAWDVKSFNSNFKPKKGYTLQKSMKSIKDSLAENENVILDTTNMSEAHRAELLSEISKEGLKDNIILWP